MPGVSHVYESDREIWGVALVGAAARSAGLRSQLRPFTPTSLRRATWTNSEPRSGRLGRGLCPRMPHDALNLASIWWQRSGVIPMESWPSTLAIQTGNGGGVHTPSSQTGGWPGFDGRGVTGGTKAAGRSTFLDDVSLSCT